MTRYYCPVCEKETSWNWYIGVGSELLALITCGFSLLLILFYKKKCIICGGYPLQKLPPLPLTEVCPACSMPVSGDYLRCPSCEIDLP